MEIKVNFILLCYEHMETIFILMNLIYVCIWMINQFELNESLIKFICN